MRKIQRKRVPKFTLFSSNPLNGHKVSKIVCSFVMRVFEAYDILTGCHNLYSMGLWEIFPRLA